MLSKLLVSIVVISRMQAETIVRSLVCAVTNLGKPKIARWAVPLLAPVSATIWAQERPCVRTRAILEASTITRGLPSRLPFARAFRKPARTLSWMSARSSSAIVPMIWNISRPEGVLKSRLSRKLMNATLSVGFLDRAFHHAGRRDDHRWLCGVQADGTLTLRDCLTAEEHRRRVFLLGMVSLCSSKLVCSAIPLSHRRPVVGVNR